MSAMTDRIDNIEQLALALQDGNVQTRRKALRAIVAKKGNQILLKIDDPGIIPVLPRALRDPDERVRKGAAYALRPWTGKDPALFSSVLPEYAIRSFDGTYTHVGLLDTRDREIWIPPWQSLAGHAALMSDGNTDRYFKFQFYLAGQAPSDLRAISGSCDDAHLIVNYMSDWSYSRQNLIDEFDSRRMAANLRKQQAHERRVVSFYRNCALPFGVLVHRTCWVSGRRPRKELAISRIGG